MKNFLSNNFDTVYNELYDKYFNYFEKIRRSKKRKNSLSLYAPFLIFPSYILIGIILLNIDNLTPFYLIIGLVLITFFFAIMFIAKSKFTSNTFEEQNYQKLYKEKVISHFISNILPDFKYIPYLNSNLLDKIKNDYSKATFNMSKLSNIDALIPYTANDYICGQLNSMNLTMCDLSTYNKYSVYEKNYLESSFKGIFAHIKLNYTKNYKIMILHKNDDLPHFENSVHLDNNEFNNNFITISDSPISVFELLTSDIIELLNIEASEHPIKFDISIIDDNIFFRFHTVPVFEPHINKENLQRKDFLRYYNLLNFIFNFSEMINNIYKESIL